MSNTTNTTKERIAQIAALPEKLSVLIDGLTEKELTTQYNPPEWTIAQNIHHLVDSHINSFVRFKRILTEDNPQLPGYDQEAWATTADATSGEINTSLIILRGLHARWVQLLASITDWSQAGYHLESQKQVTLDDLLTTYANHGEAHLQQIQDVLDAM